MVRANILHDKTKLNLFDQNRIENTCVGFIQFTLAFIFAQQEIKYTIPKKAYLCEFR